jgi:hypothetical protein
MLSLQVATAVASIIAVRTQQQCDFDETSTVLIEQKSR